MAFFMKTYIKIADCLGFWRIGVTLFDSHNGLVYFSFQEINTRKNDDDDGGGGGGGGDNDNGKHIKI